MEDRNDFLNEVKSSLSNNSVLLLNGSRDPSLEEFCKELYENCKIFLKKRDLSKIKLKKI